MARFSERPAPGLEQGYEGDLVHEEKSSFQLIQVFANETFGRMLVLDGLVQTTERDEFCYHEMLVHPALISHAEPRRVLIIGGGDGGTLRRVLEHPSVTECVMVEIDDRVTAVCREHMPSIAGEAFEDPRATVLFDDGAAYVRAEGDKFDAIIIDSSDPVGPGVVLFSKEFYGACRARLTAHGLVSAQIGSPFYFASEVSMAVTNASAAGAVSVYTGAVPTYPGTLWGYMLVGGSPADVETARSRAEQRGLRTRYWSPELQRGAFDVPRFVLDPVAHSGTSVLS